MKGTPVPGEGAEQSQAPGVSTHLTTGATQTLISEGQGNPVADGRFLSLAAPQPL